MVRDRSRRGYVLVADAVLRVTKTGKVSTFYVPPVVNTGKCAGLANNDADHPGCDSVPTGLAYGSHHTLYISALTAEVPGEGRVYVVDSRTGKLKKVIQGLSGSTGVAVNRSGTVFVSELFEGAPEGDPPPDFDPTPVGQIVRITECGARSYAPVTAPIDLLHTDGHLYASTWAIASFLGLQDAGQVVRVSSSAERDRSA